MEAARLNPQVRANAGRSTLFPTNQGAEGVTTLRSLMMPTKENGEVDWNTLGNILTARMVEEVHTFFLRTLHGE
jgi:hypothetical protein